MGKIVLIAAIVGLGYAYHKGLLGDWLEQRSAPPSAPPPQTKAEPYDPYKRYEGADVSPEARCAAARAKLEELENWSRSASGVVDAGAKDAALAQARQLAEHSCPGQ